MALKTNHEPTVPLVELGLEMDPETGMAYGAMMGVRVVVDYLDRLAVSLSDAYKLAEARRKADQEYRQAEARKQAEHVAAVKDLSKRMNAAFERARDEAMAQLAQQPQMIGAAEARGEAINAGLAAARLLWAAAPEPVRLEVTRVEAEESGTFMTYEVGMVMPKPILDHYIHTAARKA